MEANIPGSPKNSCCIHVILFVVIPQAHHAVIITAWLLWIKSLHIYWWFKDTVAGVEGDCSCWLSKEFVDDLNAATGWTFQNWWSTIISFPNKKGHLVQAKWITLLNPVSASGLSPLEVWGKVYQEEWEGEVGKLRLEVKSLWSKTHWWAGGMLN